MFFLPPVRRIRRVAIRPRRTNVYSGTIPARLGGPGVEFFGVREYARGDPPAWINWNISARHPQSLYSNEFEQERVADIGIVLDSRLRTKTYRGGPLPVRVFGPSCSVPGGHFPHARESSRPVAVWEILKLDLSRIRQDTA